MFKKIVIGILVLFALVVFAPNVFAVEKLEVYFYWAEGCPHCEKEKAFLSDLMDDDKYSRAIVIKDYEVVNNPKNLEKMQKQLAELGQQAPGVPITIIHDEIIPGFATASTTGQRIQKAIDNHLLEIREVNNDTLYLPLFGEVSMKNMSLPVITVAIGFLDGFNPCAMWALLFLISMLLNMQNRKRMWILGSLFIITSAAMYFVFMAAWLNFILLIGVVFWVRILIGAFAIGGGSWNLKKYFTRKDDSGCEVAGTEKRRKTFERMKEVVYKKNFLFSIIGIIILAFSVNLVELICSAGLPAVYTQVLAMNDLSTWQYYGYILLYVFFFMVDDLLIFFIAMTTLRATGISTKYSKWSSLIGGIIMLIIGLLLIFKPEWLMFG
ncbi:MAG: hypothetical protein V1865_02600 [bacterium]